MRTLLTGERAIISAATVKHLLKVEVQDADGAWQDWSAYAIGAKWGETVDQPVGQATISLRRAAGSSSLAPLMEASPLNVDAMAAYAPAIDIGRAVRISTSTTATGGSAVYREMFHGRVDTVAWEQDPIVLSCSDLGAWLMDTQIETEEYVFSPDGSEVSFGASGAMQTVTVDGAHLANVTTVNVLPLTAFIPSGRVLNFGGGDTITLSADASATDTTLTVEETQSDLVDGAEAETAIIATGDPVAVETVISALESHWPNGITTPSLYTPTSPSWEILGYQQDRVKLLEAMRALALQIGWDLRYRYDSAHAFRLTFMDPARDSATVNATIADTEYRDVKKLTLNLADVRNVGYVDYGSGTVTLPADPPTDPSVVKYGRRYFELEAGVNIDTEGEATAYLQAALDDLSGAPAEQEIETYYCWPVQLYDRYTFSANGVHYDTDQTLAVVGYQHSFENGEAITTITAAGRVIGAYAAWLRRQVVPTIATITVDDFLISGDGEPEGAVIGSVSQIYQQRDAAGTTPLFAKIEGDATPVDWRRLQISRDFDVLNNYGADPTGALTSAAAINQAILDADAEPFGGEVVIPAGTWLIDETILAHCSSPVGPDYHSRSLKIRGAGMGATKLVCDAALTEAFVVTGARVWCSGFSIDGIDTDGATGLRVGTLSGVDEACAQHRLEYVEALDFHGTGAVGYRVADVVDVTDSHCYFFRNTVNQLVEGVHSALPTVVASHSTKFREADHYGIVLKQGYTINYTDAYVEANGLNAMLVKPTGNLSMVSVTRGWMEDNLRGHVTSLADAFTAGLLPFEDYGANATILVDATDHAVGPGIDFTGIRFAGSCRSIHLYNNGNAIANAKIDGCLPPRIQTSVAGEITATATGYHREDVSWVGLGFAVGQTIKVTGFDDSGNDGEGKVITAVTADDITVALDTAWDSGTAYVEGDRVSSAGTNYRCILGHTNQTPPNGTYWESPAETPNPLSTVVVTVQFVVIDTNVIGVIRNNLLNNVPLETIYNESPDTMTDFSTMWQSKVYIDADGHATPRAAGAYDFGTSSVPFRTAYFTNVYTSGRVYLNAATGANNGILAIKESASKPYAIGIENRNSTTNGQWLIYVDAAAADDEYLVLGNNNSGKKVRIDATTGTMLLDGELKFGTAITQIIPGATSLAFRNNADSADNLIITDAGNATLRGSLTFATAVTKIIPGATSMSWRNNADSADNLIITDAGIATFRNKVTLGTGSSFTAGQIGLQSTTGLTMVCATGSTHDFYLAAPGGSGILSVATGGLSAVFGGGLKVTGAFGCNGATPAGAYALGGAATDPATTQTLANNLRAMAIANGIGS